MNHIPDSTASVSSAEQIGECTFCRAKLPAEEMSYDFDLDLLYCDRRTCVTCYEGVLRRGNKVA